MYLIVGSDNKEYGPVSGEEVARWIQEGRADANTRVRTDGETEWRRLRDFPEFAPYLGATPGTPDPLSPLAPGVTMHATGTNGLAVAGFVLSLLGLACCGPVFSTLALVFSAVALSQLRQNPFQGGRGLAIAGLILGIIGWVITFFAFGGGILNFWQS
jgi:hypothetical protein